MHAFTCSIPTCRADHVEMILIFPTRPCIASLPRASPRGIGNVVVLRGELSSFGMQTTSLLHVLVRPTLPDVRLLDAVE